jgi:ribosomal protein S18 acetylase RimI-like enzyme
MIQDVNPSTLSGVRAFLESHLETSLFLLHCLERFGPTLGEHRDSGNYRCLLDQDGAVVAVASATRRGHLLLQTGGRRDLAAGVMRAYLNDPVRIDGVVAEWQAADSIWPLLLARAGFQSSYEAQHVVYALAPDQPAAALPSRGAVRELGLDDFDLWYPLFHALEVQEGASLQGGRDEVRTRFAAAPWHWWGAFASGGELAAVACVEAPYRGAAHVGGLYVRPVHRGRGIARILLTTLIEEERASGRLARPVIHARVSNLPAQRLYETIGFAPVGHFAFLFGRWIGQAPPGNGTPP